MGDIAKATRLLEEAIFAPDDLAEALGEAGRALGFDHFCLVHDDLHNLRSVANDETTEALQLYAKGGWAGIDYRAAHVGHVQDNELFLDHLSVDDEKRRNNPVYSELYVPQKMAYYAGWRFTVGGSTWNLALARSEERGPVSGEEALQLQRLIPVANRALYLVHTLRETHVRGLFDGLCASQSAVVLIDSKGQVDLVTPHAERLFNIDFNIKDGKLWSAHAASNAQLEQVAKLARTREDPGLTNTFLIQRFNENRAILAQPVPIRGRGPDLLTGARIALFLSTTGHAQGISEQDLQLFFGLSKAEAQITALLAEGLEPQQVAEHRGVSVGTVRVQMKNIFQKANVRRQSELVKAIAELRPPHRSKPQ